MSDTDLQQGQDKQHEPTQQRLERARREGDVAYSTELTAAASYGALYLALLLGGGWITTQFLNLLRGFFQSPDEIGASMMGPEGLDARVALTLRVLGAVAPAFGAVMIATLASIFVQQAAVFAPGKLAPKWSRLSIVDAAKQKYGPRGLFEFAKGFVKLVAIILIIAIAMHDRILELPHLAQFPAEAFGPIIYREATFFLGYVTLAAAAIAAVDYPWQVFQHRQKLRMTTDELKRESKENEGDPYLKSQRRERGREIARNRMIADVPTANVVIVNPTHYAVALKWSREKGGAPICVAKGVDAVAARIREAAAEAGVPIRRDPPTARSIYAIVEIGQQIRREHYAAVAAAIHFADEVRRKTRKGGAS